MLWNNQSMTQWQLFSTRGKENIIHIWTEIECLMDDNVFCVFSIYLFKSIMQTLYIIWKYYGLTTKKAHETTYLEASPPLLWHPACTGAELISFFGWAILNQCHYSSNANTSLHTPDPVYSQSWHTFIPQGKRMYQSYTC